METKKIKRSKGITIFAWVMLIVGVFTLLGLDAKSFFDFYKFLPHIVVLGMYWFGVISTIIGFVAMIGILRLKEGMRKIAVAINVIDILSGGLFFFQLQGVKQSIYEMVVADMSSEKLPRLLSDNDAAAAVFVFVVFITSVVMILNLIFVWYFTRPNIKAQFK